MEEEKKEREYLVNKQVEQNKMKGNNELLGISTNGSIQKMDDPLNPSPPKDPRRLTLPIDKTSQPRKMKNFM